MTDSKPVSPAYFQAQLAKNVSEAELQEWMIDYLRLKGYLVYHTSRSDHSEPGFPDLVAAKVGEPVVFVEVKREKGKLSEGRIAPKSGRYLPGQAEWAEALEQATGVQYVLLRPSDWLTGGIGKELRGE